MGCMVDNLPTSCNLARQLIANGVGVPCRNNDCGPQRYRTTEGDTITKPYQCFGDGYCDYLPAGMAYVGDGYIYLSAPLWRTISSTTRATDAVASIEMPFFGMSSFV
jgi:hypothetical protein